MTLFSPRCEYTRVYPYVHVCVCVHAYFCGCLHAALCFWKAIFSTVTVIFGSSIFSSGFPSKSLSVHRLGLFLLVCTLHLESQVPSHFWLIAGGVSGFLHAYTLIHSDGGLKKGDVLRGVSDNFMLFSKTKTPNCSVACDQSVFHIGKVSICCLRQKHAMASFCCSLALWWWFLFFVINCRINCASFMNNS